MGTFPLSWWDLSSSSCGLSAHHRKWKRRENPPASRGCGTALISWQPSMGRAANHSSLWKLPESACIQNHADTLPKALLHYCQICTDPFRGSFYPCLWNAPVNTTASEVLSSVSVQPSQEGCFHALWCWPGCRDACSGMGMQPPAAWRARDIVCEICLPVAAKRKPTLNFLPLDRLCCVALCPFCARRGTARTGMSGKEPLRAATSRIGALK